MPTKPRKLVAQSKTKEIEKKIKILLSITVWVNSISMIYYMIYRIAIYILGIKEARIKSKYRQVQLRFYYILLYLLWKITWTLPRLFIGQEWRCSTFPATRMLWQTTPSPATQSSWTVTVISGVIINIFFIIII